MSGLLVLDDGSVINLGLIALVVKDAESQLAGESAWTVVMSGGDKLTVNKSAHDRIVAVIKERQTKGERNDNRN